MTASISRNRVTPMRDRATLPPMRTSYRLVLMDRTPGPREYRVCAVDAAPDGAVTGWRADAPSPRGRTQEAAHAACLALAREEARADRLAMASAFYLPVLRESELPGGGDGEEAGTR